MINKAIIKAVLNSATKESKDKVLSELLNHISMSYDYNDSKAGHILEMLCDSKSVISEKDINLDYINNNLHLLIYNPDKYNIKNIKIQNVDNIDGIVIFEYDYLEKVNENKDNAFYVNSCSNVNFIDHPDILKK